MNEINKITLPDFYEWAKEILNMLDSHKISNPRAIGRLTDELKDIFNKGYQLGKRGSKVKPIWRQSHE